MKKVNIDSKQFLEIENVKEYNKARKQINANDAAAIAWMKANKTNGIPAEITKTFPFAKVVNNELRSAVETWEFNHTPPVKYFCYVCDDKGIITTWTGQKLAKCFFGKSYSSAFGDKRCSIEVRTAAGLVYHGVYYCGAGDYCRLKLSIADQRKLNLI